MAEHDLSTALARLAEKLKKDPGLPVENPTASFWQDPPHSFSAQQSEKLPDETDVVIIGSGIASISTAEHLLRQNKHLRITILEARAAISGATGRNGGHIKAVPWADYEYLSAYLGRESAIKITKYRLAHLDVFLDEAAALGEAGKVGMVRRVQSLSAYYDDGAWKAAKSHREAWLEDFPEERSRWKTHESKEELQSFGVANASGCISGVAGAAWPYRFLGCILSNMLRRENVSLETYTPATGVTRSTSTTHPYEVQTTRGNISARHVIHCTNAHVARLLPALTGKVWPLRGQMTVQSVPATFPRLGASRSWGTSWAQGFDYITQSPGEDGSLYLGGGALQGGLKKDDDLGNPDDSTQSPLCLEHLVKVPETAFGVKSGTKIEKKWTGVMGFTGDGLPIVGRVGTEVSGREECDPTVGGEWVAAGWDGYGMVHCWLAGKALSLMVTGQETGLRSWFPKDEFACSKTRLDKMSPEASLARLLGL